MDARELSRLTFREELVRAVPNGILDTLYTTFAMLLAIQCYHASDLQKSLISSLPSVGLICSLLILPKLRASSLPISRISGGFYLMGAVALAVPLFLPPWAWGWTIFVSLASLCFALQVPLITQIYRFNYPDNSRGRLFSITGMVRSASAIPFGLAMGSLLRSDPSRFPVVITALCGAALWCAFQFFRLPTPPLSKTEDSSHGWSSALRHVRDDADFRILLVCWMIMGIGSIAASALFVDHLGNASRTAFPLSPEQITFVTIAVPLVSRLASSYLWGYLFDRLNLFAFRASINIITGLAIILYFWTEGPHAFLVQRLATLLHYDMPLNMAAACFGMTLTGMSLAGGNIAWVLWVTRLAPPDRVAEYQSVHTFMTGIRGSFAPFLGFWMIARIPAFWVGGICGGMAILSSLPAWRKIFSKDQREREKLLSQ